MKTSRRQFLELAASAPLAVVVGPDGLRLLGGSRVISPPGRGEGQFSNPYIIRYDASCFTINQRDTFVFSGAFHYPRCPRSLWRDRLVKFRHAGFNTIDTYAFWNYHEPEEGHVNLSEFEDFVKLVKEMGFWMIARPGPYICAEWDAGGFPHWLVAKRFPLRSNNPKSLETSQHWFSEVLPVIQRHQVTKDGPIIMVQIENEYDYWKLPDAEKKEYIRALAQMAWSAGIDVPLITCWTRQVRERSDPDMARIMDTCNFYPRWNIGVQVPPGLAKLRREEPVSPVGITELQGGWFSEFGGKQSVDQEGVNAAQINMLTKTAIEQGATYLNYYMGFGGTNFDWAAKRLTTTYDYAAPIREPGGLWDKYYAVRGIGVSLAMLGTVLARGRPPEQPAQSTNPGVNVTERVNGASAAVFVRENKNAEQRYKMTFQDPNSPTHRPITVPRQGELMIGPREMKMLPVQIPIPGSQLRYSTAEVVARGLNLDRHFLIVYDEPGRVAEVSLATLQEPQIEGDTLYQYWDQDYESVILGLRFENSEKILFVNDHLLLVLLPRDRALRTWMAEFPPTVVPRTTARVDEETRPEEPKPVSVPFIGDAALLAGTGSHKNRIWADLDFAPGEHDLALILPPLPDKCRVDGVLADFKYDRHWRTARVHLTTPPLPAQAVTLNEAQAWVEKFDPSSGQWLSTPLRALEDLGSIPYGYVKYRAQFTHSGQPRMFASTFADDAKKVFLNGKLVPEASNTKKQLEFALDGYAQPGANTIEIAYEAFGSPNFGEGVGELKGVGSVRYGADAPSATAIDSWQIQRFPAAMRGREIDPEFSAGGWTAVQLTGAGAGGDQVPAFTWCRAEFPLSRPDEAWSVAWKAILEADRDALLYLNGKFVGRYVTAGPQKEFYLPEPYLNFDGKRANVLTIVLAYAGQPQHIRNLRVIPYPEFATRRTRLEFEW